jgi:hypothetical protein
MADQDLRQSDTEKQESAGLIQSLRKGFETVGYGHVATCCGNGGRAGRVLDLGPPVAS